MLAPVNRQLTLLVGVRPTGPAGPTGPTGATGPAGADFPGFTILTSATGATLTNTHFAGNKMLTITSATDVNITINTGLTGAEPLIVEQGGTGRITFAGSATLRSRNGLRSAGQFALVTVIPKGSNIFMIGGDVSV